MAEKPRRLMWRGLSLGASALAGITTRGVLTRSWQAVSDRQVPENPADRHTPWRDALIWAAATGVAVGVARVLSARGAAAVWQAATDEAPPGVEVSGEAA